MEKYGTVKVVVSDEARSQGRQREQASDKPEKDWPPAFEPGVLDRQLHLAAILTTRLTASPESVRVQSLPTGHDAVRSRAW
jgi:hypothetical protein